MRREQADFEANFRRYLVLEQRRAILEMLARQEVDQQATVGDVLAAAESLGWGEHIGELNLSELAEALLPPVEAPAVHERSVRSQADEELEDEELEDEELEDEELEDEELEAEELPVPKSKKAGKKKAAKAGRAAKKKKTASKKKAAKAEPKKKAGKKKAAKAEPKKKKTASAGSKKSASKKKAGGSANARLRSLLRKLDADEPMSLEEAAEVLVPVVEEYGEATMQQLEAATGIGRRKLRFHIGQLVRHEYLERHGMGRGTCYTVA